MSTSSVGGASRPDVSEIGTTSPDILALNVLAILAAFGVTLSL